MLHGIRAELFILRAQMLECIGHRAAAAKLHVGRTDRRLVHREAQMIELQMCIQRPCHGERGCEHAIVAAASAGRDQDRLDHVSLNGARPRPAIQSAFMLGRADAACNTDLPE
jgi:hypothetical protein